MEAAGGPVLRAVLRQLSTAAAVRTLPTPCRARGPGVMRPSTSMGEARTPTLGVFMGLREAVAAWGEGDMDTNMEVWDPDDGFALPPPLLDLSTADFGGGHIDFMDLELRSPTGVGSPASLGPGRAPCSPPEGTNPEPITNEILHQIFAERLTSPPALLPLAAAVLAGGRRFPQARSGTRAGQAVKAGSGRCMRLRQQRRGPTSRQGFTRTGSQRRQAAQRGGR